MTDTQQRRYWGPERNAERRERYRTDEDYRSKARAQARETYVQSRVARGLPVRDEDCRENIPLLDSIAEDRTILFTTGEEVDMLTLTTEEMARALGRSQQVLYRWYAAGLFPRPAIPWKASEGAKPQYVFAHEEAVALLTVFGGHQETSQYYRQYHHTTQDLLGRSVQKARNRMRVSGVPLEERT